MRIVTTAITCFAFLLSAVYLCIADEVAANTSPQPAINSAVENQPPVETTPTPEKLLCDGLPYIDQGTSMVPLRPVCEFFGAKLTFHDGLLTVVKTFGEPNLTRSISMRMGGKSAQIWDGGASRFVGLPRAAELRLDTVFVPAKFLVEILGGELELDKNFVPQTLKDGPRHGVFVANYDNHYAGSDAARVVLINRVGKALSLRLSGPQKRRIEIGRNDKIYLQLKPGLYYYQAGSAGMKTINSSRRLLAGHQTTWAWGK